MTEREKARKETKYLGRSVEVSSSAYSLFTENCFSLLAPLFFRPSPFPTYTKKTGMNCVRANLVTAHTVPHLFFFFQRNLMDVVPRTEE